jgi:phosphoribosylformylglycinamidine cyclo-ligase
VSESYRRAGVDLEAAAKAVAVIADIAAQARRPEVVAGVGGFAGLFRIGNGRVLAAATDGVGTKLEIARMAGRLGTVGIDLVAMCADDVACTGGEPLFFLDYLAVGRVVPERVGSIVEGVAEGCRRASCALLGGETAEHPGVMPEDQFDLAGFCVGLADEDRLLGPPKVTEGDALIGLASTGLHANGFTLARSALLPRYALDERVTELGRVLADELLEPCAIYAPDVLALHADRLLHAAAHITGGGLVENVPRALPHELGAVVRRGSWPEQPVFRLVQGAAGATDDDVFATFNMGVGMVLVVGREDADQVLERIPGRSFRIGEVVRGAGLRIV